MTTAPRNCSAPYDPRCPMCNPEFADEANDLARIFAAPSPVLVNLRAVEFELVHGGGDVVARRVTTGAAIRTEELILSDRARRGLTTTLDRLP